MTFSDIVESVKNLSTEEKEEIKSLIEHYLIEEKREKIYQNYLASKQKESEKKLIFYSELNDLIESLED